jgi:hypothetical protein
LIDLIGLIDLADFDWLIDFVCSVCFVLFDGLIVLMISLVFVDLADLSDWLVSPEHWLDQFDLIDSVDLTDFWAEAQ